MIMKPEIHRSGVRLSPVLGLIGVLSITACSKIDDYMLGKDNTPKPSELQPLKNRVSVKEVWSVPVSKPQKNSAYLKLKPVVRGNLLYTADASGLVQAIERSNGKVLWSRQLPERLVSGPTVEAGVVAVGTDASGLVIMKQTDGSISWKAQLSGDVLSHPVIARDRVLAKTIDGNLYAFAVANGKKLWISDHGSPDLVLKASSSPVVVDNRLVLAGYADGRMDAVDLETGKLLWQRSIAFASGASDVERLVDIDADPVVRGDVALLASYQGYVGALSLGNGEFIWKKPASTYKNVATDASNLYMTDSNDVVWAINRSNGHVVWKQDGLKAHGLTEPVLVAGKVLVGDRTGYLHALSAENGEFLARTALGSAVELAPAVSGNQVYVFTANGRLNQLSVG